MYKVRDIAKLDPLMNKDKINYYRRIGIFPEPDAIKPSKGQPQPVWKIESVRAGIEAVKKFKAKPRNTHKNKSVLDAYRSRVRYPFDTAMKLMIAR